MNRGYLKLYRKIQENDLWLSEKFSKGQAWVDLLMLANVKRSSFFKRGVEVIVDRGQLGISEIGLSNRWGWSRDKVRRFLAHLEKRQQIIHQKNNVTTLITIVNYEEYNSNDTTKTSTKKHQDEQQKNTSKEDKKLNKEPLKHISLPVWINQESWDAFIDMRKNVKAMPTEKAVEMIITKLSKLRDSGQDPNEVLDQSTTNSWKGVFEVKKSNGNGKQHKTLSEQMDEAMGVSYGMDERDDGQESKVIDVTPVGFLTEG